MPLYLPDTNALSAYLRGTDLGLVARLQAEFADLRLSALVIAEREFGILHHSSGLRYRQKFDQLTDLLPIEPFTREDASAYAKIRAGLEKKGRGIGSIDTLIAAQAIRLSAVVITRNLKEFSRVPGLACENWDVA